MTQYIIDPSSGLVIPVSPPKTVEHDEILLRDIAYRLMSSMHGMLEKFQYDTLPGESGWNEVVAAKQAMAEAKNYFDERSTDGQREFQENRCYVYPTYAWFTELPKETQEHLWQKLQEMLLWTGWMTSCGIGGGLPGQSSHAKEFVQAMHDAGATWEEYT